MAKNVFKIPASMKRSYLDHEITISSNGMRVRPLPLKVIGFYIIGILFLVWSVMGTFMKNAPFWLIFFYVVWALSAIFFFGKYNKTKEMRFMQIPALMAYIPKSSRWVWTRSSSNPNNFADIVGITGVRRNGVIDYGDGTVGVAFLVAGTASRLLFDDDRDAIVDRVDSFWKKMGTDVEIIQLTAKEPQRVYHQLANLQRQRNNLKVNDPDLLDLLDERADILQRVVGDELRSIHQYMVLKADHMEALRATLRVVRSEVESSPLMFRSCVQLGYDDVLEMLKVLYQGRPDLDLKGMEHLMHAA